MRVVNAAAPRPGQVCPNCKEVVGQQAPLPAPAPPELEPSATGLASVPKGEATELLPAESSIYDDYDDGRRPWSASTNVNSFHRAPGAARPPSAMTRPVSSPMSTTSPSSTMGGSSRRAASAGSRTVSSEGRTGAAPQGSHWDLILNAGAAGSVNFAPQAEAALTRVTVVSPDGPAYLPLTTNTAGGLSVVVRNSHRDQDDHRQQQKNSLPSWSPTPSRLQAAGKR